MRRLFTAALTVLAVAGSTALPAAARIADGADPRYHLATAVTENDGDVGAKRRTRTGKRWKPRRDRARRQHARRHHAERGHRRVARRPGRLPVQGHRVRSEPVGTDLRGVASFYGGRFHGRPTASGTRFNQNGMTAAHRTLPFGTRVRVTHLGNGRSVVVRINDRGPYIAGRMIDLSRGAAGVIGMHSQGVARVRVTVLGR